MLKSPILTVSTPSATGPVGPAMIGGGGGGHSGFNWPFNEKAHYGITVGTADPLIATGSNRDVLVTVDFVDHRRCLRPKPGLELPQLLAGLGIVGQNLAAGIAAKDNAAGRGGRAAAAA